MSGSKRTGTGTGTAWVTSLVVDIVSWLTTSLWLMLLAGIVHADWIRGLPTLSYGKSLGIALLVNQILDGVTSRGFYTWKAKNR